MLFRSNFTVVRVKRDILRKSTIGGMFTGRTNSNVAAGSGNAAIPAALAGADVTAEQLQSFGQQQLAAYKAPKRVYLARDFPRTKNGKILRREISPVIATSRSL